MNTSVNLDKFDISKLNNKYDNAYMKELKVRLRNFVPPGVFIIGQTPIKEKVLVGLFLSVDEWKSINHWLIDQSDETRKPTIRDAILTLMEIE